MFDELSMKGSMGFNPGKPLGNIDVNEPAPRPAFHAVSFARREQLIKGGQRVCAHCKFSRQVAFGNMECHKNAVESHDRITGEPITVGWALCATQRSEYLDSYPDYCGVEGRFFEPKEPK